jgi:tRNA1(Val) A37 N6-methylase TrmN6
MIDPADDDVTHDTLLRGRVKLIQPARGFRSSLDPVLLAGFVAPPYGRFLDLGCGTGAVAFLLLARDAAATGVGVELQPRLARLALRATAANGFAARFSVIEADVRSPGLLPAGSFDLVAANPPFRPIGTGHLPPDQERAAAHHELTLSLAAWVEVASVALRPGGRLAVVFAADRRDELLAALVRRGLGRVRCRQVLPGAGAPAQRVLVEARAGSGVVEEEPPLLLHEAGGYTAELRAMLGER